MNYVQLIKQDTANGPGFRTTLFVAGCTLNCDGCFNKSAQNFRAGDPYNEAVETKIMESLKDPSIQGLSLLGGDPLEPKNFHTIYRLCQRIKEEIPGKDIWLWTGRTIEEIHTHKYAVFILGVIDVLIEGRYQKDKSKPVLQYRGSSNQRIINLTPTQETSNNYDQRIQ